MHIAHQEYRRQIDDIVTLQPFHIVAEVVEELIRETAAPGQETAHRKNRRIAKALSALGASADTAQKESRLKMPLKKRAGFVHIENSK